MRTAQRPLPSGFGLRTTAEDIARDRDLSGQIFVVTGGYAGIGLETTRVLSSHGATVVVPVRSPDKAKANVAGLARVELSPMDFLDPASIDAFAERFIASKRSLAGLVNNAGIMATPFGRDARGYEQQLSANHLGHFQLTARLWPALVATPGARVVALTSRGHRYSAFDFEDPHFDARPYDRWLAYGQAKTANVLFAVALDARGEQTGVRSFAVHPGGILTDLARHMSDEELAAQGIARLPDGSPDIEGFRAKGGKNVAEGAATTLFAALSPLLAGKGGVYCEDGDIARITPPESDDPNGVRPWAIDPEAAERLWELSERLTGVSFR